MNTSDELEATKVIYKWSIPSFCLSCRKVGEKLRSTVFPIANTKWLLELYPRGVSERYGQYMSLYLRLDKGKHVSAKFQLSILDCEKKNYAVFEDEHEYHKDTSFVCGKSNFIKQTELKRNKDLLLPNDTLTICCEISTDFNDREKQSDFSKKRKRSRRESLSEPDDSMDGDTNEVYFDNKQYSDVMFVTSDNQCINAHKVILINKSEVFANLLSMDIPVLSPDIINVKDIDYNVMYEMFRFIYTNKVDDIEKYAVKLLSPADRFKLDDLKIMCEKYLSNNLSVANAVKLLFVAEDYGLVDLKDEIMHYIALNMNEFIDQRDFQELPRYYPKIVVEIAKLSIE